MAGSQFRPLDFDDPPPCLWSKGFARHCDIRGGESYWTMPTEHVQDPAFFREHYSRASGLVWVRLGTRSRDGEPVDLDHFVQAALPLIRHPFILVTSDGDATVPSDLRPDTTRALLSSPWLKAWYTQNHDGSRPERISPFPIGLDLHTLRPATSPRKLLAELRRIRAARRPLTDESLTIFSDIGLSLASQDRVDAMRILADCSHVKMQRHRISQTAIWERYGSHSFVLSLRGNGLDCHRTWEALYLGAIVVTLSSSLDRLFQGLPVVMIKDLRELREPANLARWVKRYQHLTRADYIRERLSSARIAGEMRARLDAGSVSA